MKTTKIGCARLLRGALALTCLGAPLIAGAQDSLDSEERKVTRLTEGVYTIRHKDPFPGWVNGNTTVIIGDREALVVDSCQLSYFAKEDIAQIRQWTSKPVRYLVNTHWHQDHNGGNPDYLLAYPGLAIVAHPMTRTMIADTSPNAPREMLEQATTIRDKLKKRLETGKSDDGQPLDEAKKVELPARLAQIERVVAAAKEFTFQLPTLTFEHELSIDLGNREVLVQHLGRGNTAGDVLLYLPKERILITGDLLVSPVPFAFDGYPEEWIHTLGEMAQLDAATIVPGHGEVMHDQVYLRLWLETMRSIVDQVHAQLRLNGNMPLADVRKAVDLRQFREKFCGDDDRMGRFFDLSVGENFVALAYHEAMQR